MSLKIKKYYKEDNYIHYSNCHEDANKLLEACQTEGSNILSISSALDNSLALLLTNPTHILAIDSNITQVYLANLKKAAIIKFSYEDFLKFIGILKGDSWALFLNLVSFLDSETKEYFMDHDYLIKDIKIVNCGRFEYYFQIFSKKVLPLIHSKNKVEAFMNQPNIESQIAFYNKKFNNLRFRLMFRIFFSEFVMKMLGRDKNYFKYNKEPLAKNVKRRFELGIYNNLNNKNPYLEYVVFNKFKTLPIYLIKENYEIIKSRIDRLEIRYATLKEVLEEKNKYDFMNLSDVFEYINVNEMDLYEKLIIDSLNKNGRVLFWNMLNDRFFSKLDRINIDIKDDLAFYYKRLLCYKY